MWALQVDLMKLKVTLLVIKRIQDDYMRCRYPHGSYLNLNRRAECTLADCWSAETCLQTFLSPSRYLLGSKATKLSMFVKLCREIGPTWKCCRLAQGMQRWPHERMALVYCLQMEACFSLVPLAVSGALELHGT